MTNELSHTRLSWEPDPHTASHDGILRLSTRYRKYYVFVHAYIVWRPSQLGLSFTAKGNDIVLIFEEDGSTLLYTLLVCVC